MPTALDDNLLREYLLEELSEADRGRIEEALFSDNDLYERLQALKAELMDQYADQTLPPKQRDVFARRFLTSKSGREEALFSRALHETLCADSQEKNGARADTPAKSGWQSVREFLFFSWGWKPALALGMLISLGGSAWLLVERQRLLAQLTQAYQEREIARSEAQKNAAAERELAIANRRKQELDEKLSQTEQNLAQTRQDLNRLLQQSKPGSLLGSMLSLVLAPDGLRGGNKSEELVVPRGARRIEVQLLVETIETISGLRAEIRNRAGAAIFNQSRLRLRQTATGRSLTFSVPADRLPAGSYEISLYGGNNALLYTYSFEVTLSS